MRVIFLICFLFSFNSFASPVQGLTKYGEGQMSVMFWDLYKAELFGKTSSYQADTPPVALKITYLRDIDKVDLIEATLDQWVHIGYENEAIPNWVSQLEQIWPDIKEGSQLTIRVHPDGTSDFYDATSKIGNMNDPQFGKAFLAIWLSEKTSEPELRAQLIGEKK
ncbi:chalcone isomerase family protein [Pseudoalteromonas phenolica]|uniref:Chalcone isomerase domain-containing protein n=2 Tax=Pseudoalteromonas phenolica TaxID=161398 RepID=A0A0S2K7K4_9GAMM|nr:chalcone isomerase family protein [Pseudoalteromonas phenolica]ALO44201.1 hypothetical protein PP2015_3729 [Pseudoalteromonas phenolica]MBE0357193.1 hypothetical protein [Pseudoalteromonas phenolica O-BC30]